MSERSSSCDITNRLSAKGELPLEPASRGVPERVTLVVPIDARGELTARDGRAEIDRSTEIEFGRIKFVESDREMRVERCRCQRMWREAN